MTWVSGIRDRWRQRRPSAPQDEPAPSDVPREQVEAGQAPLAVGERTLLDDVAPGGLLVHLDHFAFSHAEFGRVWFVEDLPPTMSRHGLEALYRFPAPIQVGFFSHPLPPEDVRRRMRQEITAQEAARLHRIGQGQLVDYAEDATTRDALAALEEIEAGRTPYFFLSLYVLLLAPSKAALDKWSTQLEDVLRGLGLRAHRALARQEDGLLSLLPLGLNMLGHVRNMTASAQAHLFPFSSRQYLMPGGLCYGLHRLDRSLVVLDDFQMVNANSIVVGKQGSGKSVFLKQKAELAVLQGARCYVVDIEGEYRRLCADLGGVYLDLTASGATTLNVLDVDSDDPEGFIGAYYNFEGWLQVAIGDLTARERNVASDAYVATMARAGIQPEEPATWRRRPPLLADYYATLQARPEPEALDLAARLKPYAVGLLAPAFNAPTNVDPASDLVVFGLAGIREAMLPVRIWQALHFVWAHVLRELRPTYFIVDEAWHLLQRAGAAAELAAMARRFRKKYAGLVLATQHAADLA
ncbi:MAG: hypothetical protein KKB13_10905, partial [Chloroflexi bacterium]|nr:hypothetical protein [Chloroflexota bacterium]